MSSEGFSLNKLRGILQTKPDISLQDYEELRAKIALNWVRSEDEGVKSALRLIKDYVLCLNEFRSQQSGSAKTNK